MKIGGGKGKVFNNVKWHVNDTCKNIVKID